MRRFLGALATWALFFLASPGIVGQDGLGPLVLVALVPWALAASRTGRRAFLVEWLAAGIGSAAMCVWSSYVWSGTLLFLAIVPGFYMAVAGSLLEVGRFLIRCLLIVGRSIRCFRSTSLRDRS